MSYVLSAIDNISEWSGKTLSILVLAMVGILVLEVTLRYVFHAPTVWAHETCKHIFGSYSVLSGAYILLHSRHIKVDLLYEHLSRRGKAIVDLITYPVALLFISLMLVAGTRIALRSVIATETFYSPFASPVYAIKLMIPIAAFLLLLEGLACFTRSLMAVRRRE